MRRFAIHRKAPPLSQPAEKKRLALGPRGSSPKQIHEYFQQRGAGKEHSCCQERQAGSKQ